MAASYSVAPRHDAAKAFSACAFFEKQNCAAFKKRRHEKAAAVDGGRSSWNPLNRA
jgi:hypothetical protein